MQSKHDHSYFPAKFLYKLILFLTHLLITILFTNFSKLPDVAPLKQSCEKCYFNQIVFFSEMDKYLVLIRYAVSGESHLNIISVRFLEQVRREFELYLTIL